MPSPSVIQTPVPGLSPVLRVAAMVSLNMSSTSHTNGPGKHWCNLPSFIVHPANASSPKVQFDCSTNPVLEELHLGLASPKAFPETRIENAGLIWDEIPRRINEELGSETGEGARPMHNMFMNMQLMNGLNSHSSLVKGCSQVLTCSLAFWVCLEHRPRGSPTARTLGSLQVDPVLVRVL
jgi:hypothetical protein